ncbi:pleckstrin homology domain-containing family G member 5-like isoform X2 [Mya arenaria]|uniref:pleckstrin homology domain-containing family G member 5-like isoform X2 n=1 Tax=Mya arenaria TaxID=6604 RepID=UPI0022E45026|nr:pleckstrin homology domain-containing family G member 5-like isoform X2 [Mya arenaria]
MPKNKNKVLGTSSLKVKPKKRPGLIKQLSQPFLTSNKKNKKSTSEEKDELRLFSGYDDMFLPDSHKHAEDTVYLSSEMELESFLHFDKSPLCIKISEGREKCFSGDSGYMSPPCQSELLSPGVGTAPAKGILKKTSVSPEVRCDSPTVNFVQLQNGRATPDPIRAMSPINCERAKSPFDRSRAISPIDRAMSPIGMESIENALGFLDDIIDEENTRKNVKKSVSFGDIAEVKNFLSDSSDNDLFDELMPIRQNVSFGDVENLKRQKDECNQSFKKSVSFEDIYAKPCSNSSIHFDFLTRSQSCEQIPLHDTDSSEEEMENEILEIEEKSVIEKSEIEDDGKECGCESICEFEVEVKVVDIQPRSKVEGQEENEENEVAMDTCTVIDSFNILICHHPACTKNNENRPMLLCKECDSTLHSRPESSGHLVLDLPKRKAVNEKTARFMHTNSTPNFINQSLTSMDIEEIEPGEGDDDGELVVAMETDRNNSVSKDIVDGSEAEKKLKRKKVVKAKRRHTTGFRSHSASDIFGHPVNSDDEGSHEHRYSYHGSIDENTLMASSGRSPNQALQRVGKGTINHETFTLKILLPCGDEDIEIIAAEKNVSLRESIQPILERRRMDIDEINIFVEASKTPLPMNCETFLLGGTTMFIKQKDGEPSLPSGSQSLSKATGSKLSGGKSQSTKSKSGGSLRSRRGINLSIDDTSFPMELKASISPQGTLRENDTRKQKQPSKLTTLFSPMNKEKEKQEQLSEMLNNYSTNELPPFPELMKIGQIQFDDETFSIENDWREIVGNSQDLTKRQQDQQEAIWELLQTELQYIRSTRVISDLFLCVLLNLQNELILNEIETHKLFNNISEISAANAEFWRNHLRKVLEETRNNATPLNPSLMKQGFHMYHDIFQPYVQYCARQKVCTDYMKSQYNENDLFKTFVIWAEAQSRCNRLKLTDLLVKPMQRLTKYSLLLQAILRKTEDDHQRRDLLEMIASVDRFVHHVNATLHQQHEEEKLQAIVDKIEPYDAVDAPNDECLKLIQPYNSNFNLTAPMPGCTAGQTRGLVMQSPLKMKEYQNRMDVECLLFTDLLLICKANKRMDKYKIVKPPMRVDRIITHELKDKGSFLLIYVNEYHVPVSSFTFHGDQNAVHIWVTHIKKAQDLFQEAKVASAHHDKAMFPQSEIITEEVIGYTPLGMVEGSDGLPLLQLTRCASEEPDSLRADSVSSPINRSRSWNEMTSSSSESRSTNSHVPQYVDAGTGTSGNHGVVMVSSASDLERVSNNVTPNTGGHATVQYSKSDPTVFSQYIGDDKLQVPGLSVSAGTSESDMSSLPEFVDVNMKSKLYQRRQSRTEKRYHTADAVQELNKNQDRDNSIHKRLSWNFPNGDIGSDKQGVLKSKVMSSDSIRSIPSSSGVSSTGSLHLSPDGDICEVDSDLEMNDFDHQIPHDMNEDDIDYYTNSSQHTKSKSTPDIVSLMQDLNTGEIGEMKDGIKSVDLPYCEDPNIRLSHAQLLRMKKQLLLSSNVEASEV